MSNVAEAKPTGTPAAPLTDPKAATADPKAAADVKAPESILAEGAKGPDSILGEGEKKPDGDKSAEWKPIEYKFELPEGVSFADEGMQEVTKLFNDARLTQDAAKPIVDFYVKSVQELVESMEKAGEAAWIKTRTDWTNEILSQTQPGPTNRFDGADLATVKSTIAKAIDLYGDPGLREALSLTGADNNPAVVRALFRMAKRLTEGSHISGNPPAGKGSKDLATRLYGNDGPKTSIMGKE